MTRADLDKQPGDVAAMFDGVAERYDLMNDILSAGQVRLWRRAVARIIGAGPGDRVLDLAAGTGTSALSFTATGAEAKFLYFPDENHWILTPGHAQIWYETVFAFLAQHVLGEEWQRPALL